MDSQLLVMDSQLAAAMGPPASSDVSALAALAEIIIGTGAIRICLLGGFWSLPLAFEHSHGR